MTHHRFFGLKSRHEVEHDRGTVAILALVVVPLLAVAVMTFAMWGT